MKWLFPKLGFHQKSAKKNLWKLRTKKGYFDLYSIFLSKMSLRERLVFELIFREMALLVLRFDFFRPPKCFRTVFVPTSFAIVLSFSSTINSPISGAAVSNKSAPIFFAAGNIYFSIKGIAVLPRCLACARKIVKLAELCEVILNEVRIKKDYPKSCETREQLVQLLRTQKDFFTCSIFSSVFMTWKEFFK